MLKVALQSVRRPVSFMVFACLLVLVFALAACGGDNASTAGSSSSGSNASTNNSTTSSSSTGASKSIMTVNVKESKDAAGKDVYKFDQEKIDVKKGDTVTIQNQSDELQDFDGGDAQKAGIDVKVPVNQSANATFNNVGTFTIKSEKGATITVNVK